MYVLTHSVVQHFFCISNSRFGFLYFWVVEWYCAVPAKYDSMLVFCVFDPTCKNHNYNAKFCGRFDGYLVCIIESSTKTAQAASTIHSLWIPSSVFKGFFFPESFSARLREPIKPKAYHQINAAEAGRSGRGIGCLTWHPQLLFIRVAQ